MKAGLLFVEINGVFIHIPKCARTSIHVALKAIHDSTFAASNEAPKVMADRFALTIFYFGYEF
jgi:hypothetical protein